MSVTSNEVRKNLKQQQDEEEQSNYSFRLPTVTIFANKRFHLQNYSPMKRAKRTRAI